MKYKLQCFPNTTPKENPLVRNSSNEESCGTQLLPGEPTSEWGVDELGRYAQAQHLAIIDGERQLAPGYWRLGMALELAKRQFHHGQWEQYLESLGVDKTRASKARAIYRTFEAEKNLSGLTLDDAYSQRKRKITKNESDSTRSKEGTNGLEAFLNHVCKKAETFIDDAAFTESEEAGSLLPVVDEAINGLEAIRDFLQKQLG